MRNLQRLNKNQFPVFLRFFIKPQIQLFWLILIVVGYFFVDKSVAIFLRQFHHSVFHFIARYITNLGAGWFNLSVTILLLIIGFLIRSSKLKAFAFFLLVALIMTGITCDFIKVVLGRARPLMFFHHHIYGFYFFKLTPHFWSLPSGHTSMISASMTAMMLMWPRFQVLGIVAILLVGICRLLLEQHYLTDVFAGIWVGVIVTIIVYQQLYLRTKLRKCL